MKAIFVFFVIVAMIGMAMVGALPAPEPAPERLFDTLAHGADAVASGVKNFFD